MNYKFECPVCKEIQTIVEDRLFELRRQPAMDDEGKALSQIELILHEAEEGFRDCDISVEVNG